MSDHDEADAYELSDSTRRTFCTQLMLSSAALLLATSKPTKAVAHRAGLSIQSFYRCAGGQLWATGKSFGREGEVIT